MEIPISAIFYSLFFFTADDSFPNVFCIVFLE